MIITTRSRARRILRAMHRFKEGFPGDEALFDLQLPEGEEYIGTYTNPHSSKSPYIHITYNGIWFRDEDKLVFIPFLGIVQSKIIGNKDDAHNIELHCKDERIFVLEIDGIDGRFRDVFEFSRFITRAASDRYKEANT